MNRATFETAPVYTTIERIVLDKMCSMVGYKDGDGIFSPGNVKHYDYCMCIIKYQGIECFKGCVLQLKAVGIAI